MKTTLQKLEEIKQSNYRLDLGEAINDIFNNYKNIALLGGTVILVVSLAALVIVGGIAAVFVGAASFTETITEYTEGTFTSSFLIINLIATVVAAGLFAPVTAGILQMAHNSATNEEFDFSTAFMHYKSVYFKEIFLAAVLITLISSGISTGIEIIKLSDPLSTSALILSGVGGLLSGLISFFALLMVPLIIFGKLNAIDAIKGSFLLVYKKFWLILLLSIVYGIFAMLGLFGLCIGILFTYPVIYSLQYIIYTSALPIETNDELDEIGDQRF